MKVRSLCSVFLVAANFNTNIGQIMEKLHRSGYQSVKVVVNPTPEEIDEAKKGKYSKFGIIRRGRVQFK